MKSVSNAEPRSYHDPGVQNAPLKVRYPEMNGRVAVVTGAGGGIGRIFVEGLAKQGVHVIASDVMIESVRECAPQGESDSKQSHGAILVRATDVSSKRSNDELMDVARTEFGRLDYFVGAAGVYPPPSDVLDISAQEFRKVLEVNVEGLLYGAQAAARLMEPGGAIVTLSSVNAVRARSGRGAYSISKAAVAHLTRSLAIEFADLGIRVNSIAPGFIDTAMTRWIMDDQPALITALSKLPLHRVGSPVEVLGGLLFLLSDSARYVTGHSLAIDGGSQLT